MSSIYLHRNEGEKYPYPCAVLNIWAREWTLFPFIWLTPFLQQDCILSEIVFCWIQQYFVSQVHWNTFISWDINCMQFSLGACSYSSFTCDPPQTPLVLVCAVSRAHKRNVLQLQPTVLSQPSETQRHKFEAGAFSFLITEEERKGDCRLCSLALFTYGITFNALLF